MISYEECQCRVPMAVGEAVVLYRYNAVNSCPSSPAGRPVQRQLASVFPSRTWIVRSVCLCTAAMLCRGAPEKQFSGTTSLACATAIVRRLDTGWNSSPQRLLRHRTVRFAAAPLISRPSTAVAGEASLQLLQTFHVVYPPCFCSGNTPARCVPQ